MIIDNKENFAGVKPFDMRVTYNELDYSSPENVFDSHIHEECEIYINISGDISFMVENNIYPVKPGDIIITRPFEYHHCIYHSNKLHKHFWILFSSKGNEELLDIFYKRPLGEDNQLTLSSEYTEELIKLCHKMTGKEENEGRKIYNFFKLINLLQNADVAENLNGDYPEDVIFAINYINTNFTQNITIRDIAKGANVSINTLERHFAKTLNITPAGYMQKKRLANAVKLLSKDYSVAEASEYSGFSDYSKFISLFKRSYGITPLKYKKRFKQEKSY